MIGFVAWACYLTVFGIAGEGVLFLRAANEAQQERAVVDSRHEYTSTHMGTQWKLVLYASTEAEAKAAAKAAFARVAELEKVMSDYDGTSELMTVLKANDANPGTPLKLGDDLFDVLCKARKVTTETGGAFDPSIGPLVQLWRNSRRTRKLPDDTTLAEAGKLVGSELWTLDEKARTLTLKHARMRLDLGGIGKGYAADAAMAVLKKHGITAALIAASGDITVSAAPPGKQGWTVDIAPLRKGDEPRRLVLADQSVSTSGDLFQYVEINGVRYSHVLDPATGLGMTGYRSGTAVMPGGWQADAYTKAILLLPPEKAQALLEKHGGKMYLAVKLKPDDTPTVTQSKGFVKLLAKE